MKDKARNRCRWVTCAAAVAALPIVGSTAQSGNVTHSTVTAAMLHWRIGVERAEPANEMVETIAPVTIEGRRAWRVTHYPFEPEEGGYDLYDVDASTFSPIRSVMKNRAFDLSLMFDTQRVLLQRTEKGATVSESVTLDEPVKPEGPGHRVFVAGLPLKPGYTLKFLLVDRWSGKERSRIKEMMLSVAGPRRVPTAMGTQDVLDVTTRALDGSFRIAEQVRAEQPHYPFRIEYLRGKRPLVSEVTTMAIDAFPTISQP